MNTLALKTLIVQLNVKGLPVLGIYTILILLVYNHSNILTSTKIGRQCWIFCHPTTGTVTSFNSSLSSIYKDKNWT